MSDEDPFVVVEEVILVEIVNEDFPVTPQEDVTDVQIVEEVVSVISVAEQGPPGRDADISEDIVLIYQTAKL